MTRRISPLTGALDAIFFGALLGPETRVPRAGEDEWRAERKRRTEPVSPMRRNRFRPDRDVS